MKQLGLFETTEAYVYGFDEQPISCYDNIQTLFNTVKQAFPEVTTSAVLNWNGGLPITLPVDIWIL